MPNTARSFLSADQPRAAMTETLWEPTADRIAGSPLREFLDWLETRERRPFEDHDALWAWSVEDLDRFWLALVDYYRIDFSTPWTQVRTTDPMPHTRWFTGARLNWAEHLLRNGSDESTALVCLQEGGGPAREITFADLRRSVASAAGWLRRAGVRPGDRVAAYLPNTEHAVIGCLAAAAVGAVWACCSPDFGAEGTIGRLAQLEPTVLIATDGYHWNGKTIDRSDVVAHLRESLPTVRHVVHVGYVFDRPDPAGSTSWDRLVSGDEPLVFEPVEFSIRSGCCSRPAPPGCPKAWCTATAGSPWRGSSGPACMPGCVPASGSSPIPRPVGRCGTSRSTRSCRAPAWFSTRAAPAVLRARSGRSPPAPGRR